MVLHVQPGLMQLGNIGLLCPQLLDEVVELLLNWVETHCAHSHNAQRLYLLVQLEHKDLINHSS